MRAPGAAAATAVAVLSLMAIPAAPGAPIQHGSGAKGWDIVLDSVRRR